MDHQVSLPGHHHPLVLVKRREEEKEYFTCGFCSLYSWDEERYYCDICKMDFEKRCAQLPLEVNYPFHPRHPLGPFSTQGKGSNPDCFMCGLYCRALGYHCPLCNFIIDVDCVKNPPEVVRDRPKIHEHKLTLMPREIAFTCDACGEVGSRCPWICLHCDFVVHGGCTDLPRVIKINRHQHRISLTYFLRPGNWICGVCRRQVDRRYGTYSCSICSYAVHTKCAMNVWDWKELEGTSEEIDQIEGAEPFKVVRDGVINHFSHEHDLRLNKNGSIQYESKCCEACILPILSNPFYSCMQCDFILHEACAEQPIKKQHPLCREPLSLHVNDKDSRLSFLCRRCKRYSSGWKYIGGCEKIDIRCTSLSEPFNHEGHPHPLFFTSMMESICGACHQHSSFMLSCIECDDFRLCCRCATLPRTVRHKYDDHLAILCLGEDVSGPYWCEMCEKELDPKTVFYACHECGFTSHVHCLLGWFPFMKPGHRLDLPYEIDRLEVIENNGTSRLLCSRCELPAPFPTILKSTKYDDAYCCSLECLRRWYRGVVRYRRS